MIGPRSPTSPSARSGPVIWRDRVGHLHPPEVGHLHPPPTFDPRRVAILLIAGDKTGDDRWYDVFVPRADDPYDEHLDVLRKEGLI